MIAIRRIAIAIALLTPAVAGAQAPPAWAGFTRTFQAYVDSDHVVGASVVLIRNGRVIGRYDTGDADRSAKVAVFDPGITSPNGAWNAPVADLVKYTAFLTSAVLPGMSRERYDVVLSRKSLQEMWEPGKPMSQSYESAPSQWMGLSFFVRDRNGRRILGHTGSQAGFRSFYYFDPSSTLAVIAVFNTTNTAAPATASQRRMQEAALDLLR